MKSTLSAFAAILLLSLLHTSCKSPCSDPGLELVLQDFDSAARSVIIIEQYEPGTGFTIKRQRIVTGSAFTAPFNGDTVDIRGSSYQSIATDRDTWIKLPIAGKEFKISDISFTQEKGSQTSDKCSNTIHYKLNGISNSAKGYGFDGWLNAVEVVLKP